MITNDIQKNTTKSTNKINKTTYKPTNWSTYNQALIECGNVRLWIEGAESWWYQEGGRETYSTRAIECIATFKALFKIPLRMLEGYMRSFFKESSVYVSIPNYSTISRRLKTLSVKLHTTQKDSVDLIVDSTGLKIYGEGEWKVRKHGWNKRRVWRKVHIGIDLDGEIRTVITTHHIVICMILLLFLMYVRKKKHRLNIFMEMEHMIRIWYTKHFLIIMCKNSIFHHKRMQRYKFMEIQKGYHIREM